MESVLKNIKHLKSNIGEICDKMLHDDVSSMKEVRYPVYGVIGPSMERLGSPIKDCPNMQHSISAEDTLDDAVQEEFEEDDSDEEENEEGMYTVYECPGLAPAGEMEVRNPLFGDETPVSTPPSDEEKDSFAKT